MCPANPLGPWHFPREAPMRNALQAPVVLAALGGGFAAMSLVDILIWVVVLAACVGIVYLAMQYFGVGIPPVIVKIFWIVVIACLAIMAIRVVLSM